MLRKTIVVLFLVCCFGIALFALTSKAQKASPIISSPQSNAKGLVAYAGQVAKTQVDSPTNDGVITVSNMATSSADVDFVAIDTEGNEVGRESAVVGAKLNATFKFQDIFPALSIGSLSSVEVQASVRPEQVETGVAKQKSITTQALQLPVAFFSQRDSRWANNRLGTCSTTIGKEGCAITSVAMAGARSVYNFNPATLNTYLTNSGGYASGCLIVWSAPAKIDGSGGFSYIGSGSVKSAANLKSILDSNRFAVARSARFSSHYVVIIGYYNQGANLSDFYYLDPWDLTATFRRVGDGWVSATSATQIYQ